MGRDERERRDEMEEERYGDAADVRGVRRVMSETVRLRDEWKEVRTRWEG